MKPMYEIERYATKLLEMQPSPVAHRLLLGGVFKVSPDQAYMRSLAKLVEESRQVQRLTDEQREDGDWGAFHSRNMAAKQKIASTEAAVERAVNLGLGVEHPVLVRAKEYILSILRSEIRFPDYHEKNDRWSTGMRLFLGSTLSLIDPSHEGLENDRSLWREIAIRTFQSGTYSEKDEIRAHSALTGASVKDSYLRINNHYTLNILGSKPDLLPPAVEQALLDWLLHLERGLGYLEMPLSKEPPLTKPGPLDRWFTSVEMIIRLFHRSALVIAEQFDWIWKHQDSDGLWDFGPRSSSSAFLPLADDWRIRKDRKIDWSTRVLLLAVNSPRAAELL